MHEHPGAFQFGHVGELRDGVLQHLPQIRELQEVIGKLTQNLEIGKLIGEKKMVDGRLQKSPDGFISGNQDRRHRDGQNDGRVGMEGHEEQSNRDAHDGHAQNRRDMKHRIAQEETPVHRI